MNTHPSHHTTALYSVQDIRCIEHAASCELAPGTLMQRAGSSIAHHAIQLLSLPHTHAKILILAGPGNNGGDALEAAYHLASTGLNVSIALTSDPTQYSPEAHAAYQRAQCSTARFLTSPSLPTIQTTQWDLVIDGLFGIGLTRPLEALFYSLIKIINEFSCPILAIDIPSGLNADTGCVVGPNGIAVHATHTLTFIAAKPGLYTSDGRDYSGVIHIHSLGIKTQHFPQPIWWLNEPNLFRLTLHPRLHNSHKGLFGDVAIIGGARGMTGAPILAGRAALHLGAGRTHVVFMESAPTHDSQQPELMCQAIDTYDFSSTVLVIGPGMGKTPAAYTALEQAIHTSAALVLDADALNILATEPHLRTQLAQRQAPTLITPHPLEAARLLNISPTVIQKDRLSAASQLATQFNAITILKGSGTIVANPNGQLAVNPTGNPALATAGTGDVLSGICGALLGQGCPAWEAALTATWLHGTAADVLVKQGIGPVGLTAGELISIARTHMNLFTSS